MYFFLQRIVCFAKTQVSEGGVEISVYDKHCLSLSKEEVEANLAAGKPWVIRLNVPNEGAGPMPLPTDSLSA